MADILLKPLTTNTLTKPKRVPAHVSSTEAPISYIVEGDVGVADANAVGVYIGVPHNFGIVDHVSVTPLTTFAITATPYVITKNYIQTNKAIGADYIAGSGTLTLHADSPADAGALNNFYIRIDSGLNQGQVRKITNFASDVATLDKPFDGDMTSGVETYTILGTAIFCTADPVGGDPVYSVSVTGK